jgi:hypothetical protein
MTDGTAAAAVQPHHERPLPPAPGQPVSLQWFFTRLFWACLAPLVLLAAGLAWERVHALQARQDMLARYDLTTVCLPQQLALVDRVAQIGHG